MILQLKNENNHQKEDIRQLKIENQSQKKETIRINSFLTSLLLIKIEIITAILITNRRTIKIELEQSSNAR